MNEGNTPTLKHMGITVPQPSNPPFNAATDFAEGRRKGVDGKEVMGITVANSMRGGDRKMELSILGALPVRNFFFSGSQKK